MNLGREQKSLHTHRFVFWTASYLNQS